MGGVTVGERELGDSPVPETDPGDSPAPEDEPDYRFELADRLRNGYRKSAARRAAMAIFAILLLVVGVAGFAAYRVEQERGPDGPGNATRDFGFNVTPRDVAAGGPTPQPIPGVETVSVQIWDGFNCPDCRRFHRVVKKYLKAEAGRGHLDLTYYPFVDEVDATTNRFAARAANAAACVGDAAGVAGYVAMRDELFRIKPGVGKPGPGDARLIELAEKAGATGIEACIVEERFAPWLAEGLSEARRLGIVEAPTLRVGGRTIVSPGKNGEGTLPDLKELKFVINSSRNP